MCAKLRAENYPLLIDEGILPCMDNLYAYLPIFSDIYRYCSSDAYRLGAQIGLTVTALLTYYLLWSLKVNYILLSFNLFFAKCPRPKLKKVPKVIRWVPLNRKDLSLQVKPIWINSARLTLPQWIKLSAASTTDRPFIRKLSWARHHTRTIRATSWRPRNQGGRARANRALQL